MFINVVVWLSLIYTLWQGLSNFLQQRTPFNVTFFLFIYCLLSGKCTYLATLLGTPAPGTDFPLFYFRFLANRRGAHQSEGIRFCAFWDASLLIVFVKSGYFSSLSAQNIRDLQSSLITKALPTTELLLNVEWDVTWCWPKQKLKHLRGGKLVTEKMVDKEVALLC